MKVMCITDLWKNNDGLSPQFGEIYEPVNVVGKPHPTTGEGMYYYYHFQEFGEWGFRVEKFVQVETNIDELKITTYETIGV